jgi:hypothetical protein
VVVGRAFLGAAALHERGLARFRGTLGVADDLAATVFDRDSDDLDGGGGALLALGCSDAELECGADEKERDGNDGQDAPHGFESTGARFGLAGSG